MLRSAAPDTAPPCVLPPQTLHHRAFSAGGVQHQRFSHTARKRRHTPHKSKYIFVSTHMLNNLGNQRPRGRPAAAARGENVHHSCFALWCPTRNPVGRAKLCAGRWGIDVDTVFLGYSATHLPLWEGSRPVGSRVLENSLSLGSEDTGGNAARPGNPRR